MKFSLALILALFASTAVADAQRGLKGVARRTAARKAGDDELLQLSPELHQAIVDHRHHRRNLILTTEFREVMLQIWERMKEQFGEDGITFRDIFGVDSIDDFAFASDLPSYIPSDAPSNMPSDMPSDMPSNMPSDAPSDAPSDMPSDVPTNAPSITPPEWQEKLLPDLGSLPEDFDTCPSTALTSDTNIRYSTVTVMYEYRLELEPRAFTLEAIQQIEDALQDMILESACGNAIVAVNPAPLDEPGAECRNVRKRAGKGPCLFVSGFTSLIATDPKLFSGVYCDTLLAIHEYINGEKVTKIPGVVATNSTIVGSLVPAFCNAVDFVGDTLGIGATTEEEEEEEGIESETETDTLGIGATTEEEEEEEGIETETETETNTADNNQNIENESETKTATNAADETDTGSQSDRNNVAGATGSETVPAVDNGMGNGTVAAIGVAVAATVVVLALFTYYMKRRNRAAAGTTAGRIPNRPSSESTMDFNFNISPRNSDESESIYTGTGMNSVASRMSLDSRSVTNTNSYDDGFVDGSDVEYTKSLTFGPKSPRYPKPTTNYSM